MSQGDDTGRTHTAADEEAERWYARLQHDENPDTRARFESWWNSSSDNRAAYDRLSAILGFGDMLGGTPTGQARQLGRAPFWQRQNVRHASATLALIAVAIGGSVLLLREPGPQPATFAAQEEERETQPGERRILALNDGSRIRLDPDSRLRISYSESVRQLALDQGRARFKVARRDPRPFVVTTPAGAIIAHGTVFDVSISGRNTRVALIEGSIEVHAAREPRQARTSAPAGRFLSPGQEVVLTEGSSIVPSPRPAAQDQAPRTSDMLSFDATPLDQAVEALNRRNARKVALADPVMAKLRVTGAFKIADPAGFASATAAMFDLVVRTQTDGSLLIDRPENVST